MLGDARRIDACADDLVRPSSWLVFGLQWRGEGGMAEAAAAVAPGMIPREALSHDAHQVLGCADLYARKYGRRVIFFSDLTAMFAAAGTSWSGVGVDWESALRELRSGPFPLMFLTVSERAYSVICNPAKAPRVETAASADTGNHERELVRQAVEEQLGADWAPYMRSMVDAGRVSRVV